MTEHDSRPNAYLGLLRQSAPPPPQRRGRKQVTGRYETREELIEAVWRDRENTERNLTEIGRAQGVSAAVVGAILKGERPLTLGPKPGQRAVKVFESASEPALPSDEAAFEAALQRLHANPSDKEAWAVIEAARAAIGVPVRNRSETTLVGRASA